MELQLDLQFLELYVDTVTYPHLSGPDGIQWVEASFFHCTALIVLLDQLSGVRTARTSLSTSIRCRAFNSLLEYRGEIRCLVTGLYWPFLLSKTPLCYQPWSCVTPPNTLNRIVVVVKYRVGNWLTDFFEDWYKDYLSRLRIRPDLVSFCSIILLCKHWREASFLGSTCFPHLLKAANSILDFEHPAVLDLQLQTCTSPCQLSPSISIFYHLLI